jgi:hypothetical protein
MNIFEKTIVKYAKVLYKTNDFIEEKYGIDVMDKLGERLLKEEQWEKEHPVGNVFKQLGKGALRGVGGEIIGEIITHIRKK